MSEKYDFIEFQKKMKEQYNVDEPELDRLKRAHILTFFTNSTNGAILAKLPGGGVVFRHKEGGMQINTGETWVCELLERGTTFFAIGLLRIDSKFFFDLRSDQVDRLADIIWKDNQSVLEPRFEEMYRKRMEQALDVRLQESKRREEETLANVEELKAEIEAITNRNKMIVGALEKELADVKDRRPQQHTTQVEPASSTAPDFFVAGLTPRIRRISADEISSEDFRHRNYFVHVSADHGILTIKPHDGGNVVCLDHKIILNGLGLISPFNGPTDMPAEYNPKYAGYVVYLRYASKEVDG